MEAFSNQALVDSIVAQAVAQPVSEEQARAERLKVLTEARISTQTVVNPERYALSVDGVGIFALRDIHGVKGKQKSGKSGALKVFVAALLNGLQFRVKSELEEPVVLFIDTEQQAADVKLVIDEIPYERHGGNRADLGGYAHGAYILLDAAVSYESLATILRVLEMDVDPLVQNFLERFKVDVGIGVDHSVLLCEKSDGTIHCARVKIEETEILGHQLGESTLAGCGKAVNGNGDVRQCHEKDRFNIWRVVE